MTPRSSPRRSTLWHPDVPFQPRRSPVFYGWVIVAVATIGILGSIPGQTIGLGVFIDSLMEALSLSRVDISLAYLIGTLASGILMPLGGRLLDRWGARRMGVTAALGMAVSLVLLAYSDRIAATLRSVFGVQSPWLPAFLLACLAFLMIRFWGQGMITLSCRNMIAKWFNHRRGLAVGVSGVSTALLFSASPALLNYPIEGIGWRWTLVGLAVATLLCLAPLAWVFFRDNPEECGLSMDGDHVPKTPARANADLTIYRDYDLPDALRTGAFWIFTLSFAWQGLFVTAYTFHVVSIGASIGMDRAEILQLFLFSALFAVTANMACGWLSARTRVKYLLLVMNAMVLVFALGPLLTQPLLAKLMIVIGMGVAGGLWSNLSGVVFPRFFGRAHLGAITGVFMSVIIYGSALGPYFFGLMQAFFGDYRLGFLISAAVPVALMIASLRADNPQRSLAPQATPSPGPS